MRLRNGNKEVIAFINPSLTSELKISCQANVISASNHELYASSRGVTDNLTGSGSVSATVPANGFAVYVSKDISGVSDISTLPAARVIGGKGRIIIEGDYSTVHISDIAGRSVNTLEVPAGLYIVTLDGTSSKVIVK